MKNEVIDLKHGKIDVLQVDNIIYFTVYGDFMDDDIAIVTKYTENFFVKKKSLRSAYGT